MRTEHTVIKAWAKTETLTEMMRHCMVSVDSDANEEEKIESRPPTEYLAKLRQNIDGYFDEGNLRDLCFDMGIDYDNLPGLSKKDKARGLVTYCKNRDRITDLVSRLKDARPNVLRQYDAN